jgi:hypothetical protein
MNKTASIRIAEAELGGPVRIIDINASTGEVTFALKSEAIGYPVNWKITKTFTLQA